MKINEELIDKLAALAKLEFDHAAKTEIIKDLNNIISYIDKLNELDTSNVEPLVYITPNKNILRKDEAKTTLSKQEALKNAPKHDSDYFKVPKVIN